MYRSIVISAVSIFFFASPDAWGDPHASTFSYPRVYGATGRLYGPTQAHYQYQRQNGRPWHGYRGLSTHLHNGKGSHFNRAGRGNHIRSFPAYGYGSRYVVNVPQVRVYAGPGYGYGYPNRNAYLGYSTIPMAPSAIQAFPQWIGQNPFDNEVLRKGLEEDVKRWGERLIFQPKRKTVKRHIVPSTPEAKLRSLRSQTRGDKSFRRQSYAKARRHYKTSVSQAKDRAEAHFRLGFALVAMGRYAKAVHQMKQGLQIDPTWPTNGASLEKLFGLENKLAKASVISRAVHRVREDIRDPDRLFLLGVLLHFDDDAERASIVFETALRLAGSGEHLEAFLRPLELSEQPAKIEPAVKDFKPSPKVPPFPAPPQPE